MEPHAGLEFFIVEGERGTLEELGRLAGAGMLRAVVSETVELADDASAFADKPRGQGKRVIEVRAS